MIPKYVFVICPILMLLGSIIQGCFIKAEVRNEYLKATIRKGCASLVFVILGIICSHFSANAGFARLVVIGLVLGMVGDILLDLRFVLEKYNQKIFLAGIAAFLAGHILYLSALIPESKSLLICIPVGIILAGITLWQIFSHIEEVKLSFKIFGVVYIGAVVLMTTVAFGNLITAPGTTTLLYAIGAISFTASDIILIFNTFSGKSKKSLRITNLSLYYLGQLLIAFSLLFT